MRTLLAPLRPTSAVNDKDQRGGLVRAGLPEVEHVAPMRAVADFGKGWDRDIALVGGGPRRGIWDLEADEEGEDVDERIFHSVKTRSLRLPPYAVPVASAFSRCAVHGRPPRLR